MPRAARQGRNAAIPSSYKDQGPGNYELFYVYFSGETDSSFSFSVDQLPPPPICSSQKTQISF